jgi:hypothetical protein
MKGAITSLRPPILSFRCAPIFQATLTNFTGFLHKSPAVTGWLIFCDTPHNCIGVHGIIIDIEASLLASKQAGKS